MERADVVVVGGGCTGASIAYSLARKGAGRVVLVEKQSLASGATGRSSAIIRQHYANQHLARMALHSLRVFQNFGELVGGHCDFRPVGFLVLVGPSDIEAIRGNVNLQREVGVNTSVLLPAEINELDARINVEDIGAGAYEPESGYADPASTTLAFAKAAQQLGAAIWQGTEATALVARGGRIQEVHTSRGPISTSNVVIATGYRAREMAAAFGLELPITPVRHSIAVFQRPTQFGPSHPVVSDRIQGAYFRSEGSALTLVGSSDPTHGYTDTDIEADRRVASDQVEEYALRMVHRFPLLEESLVRRGYTGVYDTTPDRQPILGALPAVEGFYCACGFSGHGFKLSPVVGEAMAELVVHGKSSLVDLRVFRPTRFAEGDLVPTAFRYSSTATG